MNELIKILLDVGLTINAKDGSNISKSENIYIFQESHKGCIDNEDYNYIIEKFLNDNNIEL